MPLLQADVPTEDSVPLLPGGPRRARPFPCPLELMFCLQFQHQVDLFSEKPVSTMPACPLMPSCSSMGVAARLKADLMLSKQLCGSEHSSAQ